MVGSALPRTSANACQGGKVATAPSVSVSKNIFQGNQIFHPPQLGVQEVAGTEADVWLQANAVAPMDSLARPVALQPPIDQI